MLPYESPESIFQCGSSVFGVGTPGALINRTEQEFLELCDAVKAEDVDKIRGEIADVIIMLYQLAGTCGIDAQQAVDIKMVINRNRKWRIAADGTGQHIEESV